MTQRVLLGQRGTDYGLWVSEPSVDVLTATDDQLLLNPTRKQFQIIDRGTIPSQSTTTYQVYTLTHANWGFTPLFFAYSVKHAIKYKHISATQTELHLFYNQTGGTHPIYWIAVSLEEL